MIAISNKENRIILLGASFVLILLWVCLFYFAPKHLKFIYFGDTHQVISHYGVEFIETTVNDPDYFKLADQYRSIQRWFQRASFITLLIPIMLLAVIDTFNRREKYILGLILVLNGGLSVIFTRVFLTFAQHQSRTIDFKIEDSLWALLCYLNYLLLKFVCFKLKRKNIVMSTWLLVGLICVSGFELFIYEGFRLW